MAPTNKGPWLFRDIEWRKLWGRQDYANFCLTACIIIAVILVTVLAEPHVVPYVIWDGRIAYPLNSDVNTIPSWVAVFVPLVMLALTIGLGEFLAARRMHNSVTDAVSTAVYFFLDGVQSFIMGLLLTQVFKVMVGRLRPNFLSRCQPIVPANAVFSLQNITASISETDNYPCGNSDSGMVKEGRLAFPSGHASISFNLAVYASGYLIWVWHWRRPSFAHRLSFGQEFRNDLVNVLAKAWMLAMLCFAWGVGISRIIDYQHDVGDVIGGALLGIMIALVYLLRAIPRWRRVLEADRASDRALVGTITTSGDVEMPLSGAGNGAGKQHSTAMGGPLEAV